MINALTIDVEDYFHVHAFNDVIRREDWDDYECRVESNVDRILQILDCPGGDSHLRCYKPAKGTFFVLGWVAERYPKLIRKIYQQGHEIACHGYAHDLIYHQTKDEFREDIRRSKAILEEITGCEVIGYRAPTYSIREGSKWAFEVLSETGFKYDSSIFPIHHDLYGMPRAPRFPFMISINGNNDFGFSVFNCNCLEKRNSMSGSTDSEVKQCHSKFATQDSDSPQSSASHPRDVFPCPPNSGLGPRGIVEFPLSTVRLCGKNIPVAGGGYFRLFPYGIIKKGLKRINEKEGMPFIFYLHPWEIDPEQPRINHARRLSKFRHYVNLDKTERRLREFLGDFNFAPVKEVLRLSVRARQKPSTYPEQATEICRSL